MAGPCLRAKIYAKGNNAKTSSWSLPLYFAVYKSPSIMMAVGDSPVLINERIANELDIKDGDNMWFKVEELEGKFCYTVCVCNNMEPDFCINGAIGLKPAMVQPKMSSNLIAQTIYSLKGKQVDLLEQQLFSGMKIIQKCGMCVLHFDGGCRNNPKGPAGYGFHISALNGGKELVKGYGYKSGENTSNTMEYTSLIEGAVWARRINPQILIVKGDSELVINQVIGKYKVNNPGLRLCHKEVRKIIQGMVQSGTQIQYETISREENGKADKLANLGMDLCENRVEVNWINLNMLMGGKL